MSKLKTRIKNWLLKEKIEELAKLQQECAEALESMNIAWDNLDNRYKNITNLIEVGVDHHMYHEDNNWAVVCVGGKSDYVRFARFSARDIRELQHFIKKFEEKNVRCDSAIPKELLFDFGKYWR